MNNVIRFSPNRMQNEFDRIFNDFFPARHVHRASHTSQNNWTPNVDLSESEDGYNLAFDLPGMAKKDITINFQEGVLTVSGNREDAVAGEGQNFLRLERRSGAFERSFKIPNAIQTDKISAAYKDGVLTISLLKAEEVKPIKVKVS